MTLTRWEALRNRTVSAILAQAGTRLPRSIDHQERSSSYLWRVDQSSLSVGAWSTNQGPPMSVILQVTGSVTCVNLRLTLSPNVKATTPIEIFVAKGNQTGFDDLAKALRDILGPARDDQQRYQATTTLV